MPSEKISVCQDQGFHKGGEVAVVYVRDGTAEKPLGEIEVLVQLDPQGRSKAVRLDVEVKFLKDSAGNFVPVAIARQQKM